MGNNEGVALGWHVDCPFGAKAKVHLFHAFRSPASW